jgi:hypothetical protein
MEPKDLQQVRNKTRNAKFNPENYPKDSPDKTIMSLDKFLFTKETIVIDGQTFRVPKCTLCGKGMVAVKDDIEGKVTGYGWQHTCNCYSKNVILYIG